MEKKLAPFDDLTKCELKEKSQDEVADKQNRSIKFQVSY